MQSPRAPASERRRARAWARTRSPAPPAGRPHSAAPRGAGLRARRARRRRPCAEGSLPLSPAPSGSGANCAAAPPSCLGRRLPAATPQAAAGTAAAAPLPGARRAGCSNHVCSPPPQVCQNPTPVRAARRPPRAETPRRRFLSRASPVHMTNPLPTDSQPLWAPKAQGIWASQAQAYAGHAPRRADRPRAFASRPDCPRSRVRARRRPPPRGAAPRDCSARRPGPPPPRLPARLAPFSVAPRWAPAPAAGANRPPHGRRPAIRVPACHSSLLGLPGARLTHAARRFS